MLKSMTAFARTDTDTGSDILTWELRSVNHRYLEPSFKLPDAFREIEPELRETLRNYLSRGKIDCLLKWQPALLTTHGLRLNETVLASLSMAAVVSATPSITPRIKAPEPSMATNMGTSG